MSVVVSRPSTLDVAGPSVLPSIDCVDVPCSMLARDFGVLGSERWSEVDGRFVLTAPKGSVAVIESEDASLVVELLRASGPKTLQLLASALALRSRGVCSYKAADLTLSYREDATALLDALTRVRFVTFPSSRRHPRLEPLSPMRSAVETGDGGRFALSEEWLGELGSRERRVAKLPCSFLGLHAKNHRYTLLLAWHLAIMLRVNRKYGFHYRVTLRMLLEGAGIDPPSRNVGRFLAAIYRSLGELPGIRFSGPSHSLYSGRELLDSKFSFTASPMLVAAYCQS